MRTLLGISERFGHRLRLTMDAPTRSARIVAMATAVPAISVTTAEVGAAVGRVRGRAIPQTIGKEAGRTRYFAQPLASLMLPRTQSQQTDAYLEHARQLARRVCCDVLERGAVPRADIGLVIGVSCTGVVLPSLDAELVPVLGLRPEVARLPITELGCGGGVSALGRALDYLRAYPEEAVLLFAVELPSLTFQPADRSLDNLVATMVFGDGAAAAVLRAADSAAGWTVERCGTVLVPEGAKHLGYELRDGGLRVVLSRDLPDVVAARLRPAVVGFLRDAGITLAEIDAVAAHPGGPRIIDAIEQALTLGNGALTTSRDVFANVGNPSSAGIFFVLEAMARSTRPQRVLAIAFGPGLSIELALMRFSG
jgi:alkylresorcinol/alkylpyrone synthase